MTESKRQEIIKTTDHSPGGIAELLIPQSAFGSAIAGLVFTIPLGIVATALAVYGFELYGAVLFCLSPFSVGLGSTLIYGYHKPRSYRSGFLVSQISILLLGFCIFLLAMEGAICLIMAMPLAMALSAIGGVVGSTMSSKYFKHGARNKMLLSIVIGLPLLMGFENATYESHRIEVATEVFVNAPPEVVWEHLIDTVDLPVAETTLFLRGVAYPTDMSLDSEGVGARLTGDFTTGPFEIVVDEWDAPHRLAISVETHPPTMQEWSIYGEIDAPHIVGYFECESGLIELEETPEGDTLLRGTTRCRQDLGPTRYWTLWSEMIIDGLHQHVLEDIGRRAEAAL